MNKYQHAVKRVLDSQRWSWNSCEDKNAGDDGNSGASIDVYQELLRIATYAQYNNSNKAKSVVLDILKFDMDNGNVLKYAKPLSYRARGKAREVFKALVA